MAVTEIDITHLLEGAWFDSSNITWVAPINHHKELALPSDMFEWLQQQVGQHGSRWLLVSHHKVAGESSASIVMSPQHALMFKMRWM